MIYPSYYLCNLKKNEKNKKNEKMKKIKKR